MLYWLSLVVKLYIFGISGFPPSIIQSVLAKSCKKTYRRCHFILESEEFKDEQETCEEQNSWIFHFHSFINFSSVLKKWNSRAMLFHKCLYQQAASEVQSRAKWQGKTFMWNINPKKKPPWDFPHFYLPPFLPPSILFPLIKRWACLEFLEPIWLPDSDLIIAQPHVTPGPRTNQNLAAVQLAEPRI